MGKTAEKITQGVRSLIKTVFGEEKLLEFTSNICDCWPIVQKIYDLETP